VSDPDRARERYEDIVDAICAWHDDARAGKVFGMPCVKRAGKVVFGLSRTGMVFKLTDPDVHRRALAVPGTHLFALRSGRVFRQWVVYLRPRQRVGRARLQASAGSRCATGGLEGGDTRQEPLFPATAVRTELPAGSARLAPCRMTLWSSLCVNATIPSR
jgi:hypothetical protein